MAGEVRNKNEEKRPSRNRKKPKRLISSSENDKYDKKKKYRKQSKDREEKRKKFDSKKSVENIRSNLNKGKKKRL